jgi:hypothetical protein
MIHHRGRFRLGFTGGNGEPRARPLMIRSTAICERAAPMYALGTKIDKPRADDLFLATTVNAA